MKTWHAHIAAVRHGALEGNDDPKIEELLRGFLQEQRLSDVETRELLGDAESRKMLFWNGYERECSGNRLVFQRPSPFPG